MTATAAESDDDDVLVYNWMHTSEGQTFWKVNHLVCNLIDAYKMLWTMNIMKGILTLTTLSGGYVEFISILNT